MKINKLILTLFVKLIERSDKKRYSSFTFDPIYEIKKDINYLNDNNPRHTFDLILAPKAKRNNICVIDIHGGAYIFGKKTNNYTYGNYYLKEGFDFITIEYEVNDGKRSCLDIIKECGASLKYIEEHRLELGLDKDRFIITGDSAGGHLALSLAEMYSEPKYANKVLKYPIKLDLEAVLLNCTTFDYINLGRNAMSKSGLKRMLGKDYNDLVTRTLIDPKTHLNLLNIPLFLSTCKNDFIRQESLMLNEAMEKLNVKYQFIDLDIDDKQVNHVHNVTMPDLEASKIVNDAMIKFIYDSLAK